MSRNSSDIRLGTESLDRGCSCRCESARLVPASTSEIDRFKFVALIRQLMKPASTFGINQPRWGVTGVARINAARNYSGIKWRLIFVWARPSVWSRPNHSGCFRPLIEVVRCKYGWNSFHGIKKEKYTFRLNIWKENSKLVFSRSNIQKIELFININNFCNVYNFEKLLLLFYKIQEMLIDFII